MEMTVLFFTAGFIFFFWLGYNFGRRTEKWAQNHPKKEEGKELPEDKVKEFLDNLNKN